MPENQDKTDKQTLLRLPYYHNPDYQSLPQMRDLQNQYVYKPGTRIYKAWAGLTFGTGMNLSDEREIAEVYFKNLYPEAEDTLKLKELKIKAHLQNDDIIKVVGEDGITGADDDNIYVTKESAVNMIEERIFREYNQYLDDNHSFFHRIKLSNLFKHKKMQKKGK